MKHLPLLLFLAACAPSAPTTYSQGVPVAPRPPAFNPTTDAPHTVGQPGHLRPPQEYPRSPHGRVLPQTPETRREPGIWAANTPEPGTDGFVEVLEELIPAPREDDDKYRNERGHIEACAAKVDGRVRSIVGGQHVNKMDRRVRACLARKLMSRCLAVRDWDVKTLPPHRTRTPDADRAKVFVERDMDNVCTVDIRAHVNAELNRLAKGGYRDAP